MDVNFILYLNSSAKLRSWDPGQVREFLRARHVPTRTLQILYDGGVAGEMLLEFTKRDYDELDMGLKPAETVLVIKKKNDYIEGTSAAGNSDDGANSSPRAGVRQRTRTFWRPVEKELMYRAGNWLEAESGAPSIDEPAREFKLFSLEKNSLQDVEKQFVDKLAKFASACLNERVNGTIYYGIADAKEGQYRDGEVVGMDIKCHPTKAHTTVEDWVQKHLRAESSKYLKSCNPGARKAFSACISPAKLVQIENSTRVVIEVDVRAEADTCKYLVFPINYPNTNDKKNSPAIAYYYRREGNASIPVTEEKRKKKFIEQEIPQNQMRRLREEKAKALKNPKLDVRLDQIFCKNEAFINDKKFR